MNIFIDLFKPKQRTERAEKAFIKKVTLLWDVFHFNYLTRTTQFISAPFPNTFHNGETY